MARLNIETLLKSGSTEWNKLRKAGKVATEHTGATFAQLFSANADLSGLGLVGSEWDGCDLSRVSFRDADLSNAYFHGGRLQDCDFRGANLEGAQFEGLKLLRCDFTGARGLEEVEFEEVDMDKVNGLSHQEEEAPRRPPPAVGITSFTREDKEAQQAASLAQAEQAALDELPPFRPHDSPGALLNRALKPLDMVPVWVLDVPGLRPSLPGRLTAGSGIESLYREAVKTRMENHQPVGEPSAIEKAQQALRLGNRDAAVSGMYLKEVGEKPRFRFAAAESLRTALRRELDVDDLTGQVDPRVTGALLELKLVNDAHEFLDEVKRRLAAAQLFVALLEAGFQPDNNWEEAVDNTEGALNLAMVATNGDRAMLTEAFSTFTTLPDEVRARRLAYLAEASGHLEALSRLSASNEPVWLHAPEYRECHDREMDFVQSVAASEIPVKVAELAQAELGVSPGEVPEDSEDDLFVHVRCSVCGKEKLIVQSP